MKIWLIWNDGVRKKIQKFIIIPEYLLHSQIQRVQNKVVLNGINWFITRIIIHEQNILLEILRWFHAKWEKNVKKSMKVKNHKYTTLGKKEAVKKWKE